jgi:hypothetical protein
MRIVKSLLAGVVLAILATVVGTFVELALAVGSIAASGEGGLGAVSFETFFPLYALVGFVAGLLWQWRRSDRTRLAATAAPPSLEP